MREKTVASRIVHEGRILSLEVLDVELDSGVRARREVVRHGGAVAILARLPDGSFILVRQFRKPVESEVVEIVAGCLEAGETPEACAVREVKEETGYDVVALTRLGKIWTSPGYSSEVLHLFYADLAPEAGGQSPDDDECLRTVRLTEPEFEAMIGRNEIMDAKTLSTWCLWKAGRK